MITKELIKEAPLYIEETLNEAVSLNDLNEEFQFIIDGITFFIIDKKLCIMVWEYNNEDGYNVYELDKNKFFYRLDDLVRKMVRNREVEIFEESYNGDY